MAIGCFEVKRGGLDVDTLLKSLVAMAEREEQSTYRPHLGSFPIEQHG
jgi:hypothetical protein